MCLCWGREDCRSKGMSLVLEGACRNLAGMGLCLPES